MIGRPLERLKLRDGRVVAVRPLERCDRPLLAAAIAQPSGESRSLRFGTPKSRVTERELDGLVDVDHHAREALLAIDPLGSALVAELTRHARDEGHSALRAGVLANQWPIDRVAVSRWLQGSAEDGHAARVQTRPGRGWVGALSALGGRRPSSCAARASLSRDRRLASRAINARTRGAGQTCTPAAVVIQPANTNAVWRSDDSRSKGSSAEIASRGITTSYQRSAALAAVF